MLAAIPYTAPNFILLVAVRSALGAMEGYAAINPLIPDYIKSESRGVAIAARSTAFLIGEIFNILVLFGDTVRMDLKTSFPLVAAATAVLQLILPCLLKEPPELKQSDFISIGGEPITNWSKIKQLTN